MLEKAFTLRYRISMTLDRVVTMDQLFARQMRSHMVMI